MKRNKTSYLSIEEKTTDYDHDRQVRKFENGGIALKLQPFQSLDVLKQYIANWHMHD